ncbi:MAG: hypothetical protein LGR52_10690 [Candidatus Thiosymbion ectosymbiont of Robbea hypermnestra]|nr:hypothetical protein [Candidatus Thiosymbion ectosymbiont of Robbea hypermnestra]
MSPQAALSTARIEPSGHPSRDLGSLNIPVSIQDTPGNAEVELDARIGYRIHCIE